MVISFKHSRCIFFFKFTVSIRLAQPIPGLRPHTRLMPLHRTYTPMPGLPSGARLAPHTLSPSHFCVVSLCLWPAGHLHSKEPTVLMQFPPWHNPGIAWHSSTSAGRRHFKHHQNRFPDYIRWFRLCTRENAVLNTTGRGKRTLPTCLLPALPRCLPLEKDACWRPTCAGLWAICRFAWLQNASYCVLLLRALLVLALSSSLSCQHKVNVPSVFPYGAGGLKATSSLSH